jgi:hypothetical protein
MRTGGNKLRNEIEGKMEIIKQTKLNDVLLLLTVAMKLHLLLLLLLLLL